MKCPKCRDKSSEVETCITGNGKLDYILACLHCSWQVTVTALEDWIKRWRT